MEIMSELWPPEKLCFGSAVVSLWFCGEVLGYCSSRTIFSSIIRFLKLLLLLSSDVKNSWIFEFFEMVSFIFVFSFLCFFFFFWAPYLYFSFLFWAPNLYLKVHILLKRRKFIPNSNNSILELFYSKLKNILCA